MLAEQSADNARGDWHGDLSCRVEYRSKSRSSQSKVTRGKFANLDNSQRSRVPIAEKTPCKSGHQSQCLNLVIELQTKFGAVAGMDLEVPQVSHTLHKIASAQKLLPKLCLQRPGNVVKKNVGISWSLDPDYKSKSSDEIATWAQSPIRSSNMRRKSVRLRH